MRVRNAHWVWGAGIVVVMVCSMAWNGVFAIDEVPDESATEPLTIISDRLDAYEDKMTVIFSGNVVVAQKDITLRTDTLTVTYTTNGKDDTAGRSESVMQGGRVKTIEAVGHVEVDQGVKKVTGEHALLYQDDKKIIVTGNVVMKDGANIIEGEKATFFFSENRGIVEGSPSKRVKATLYPETKEKLKDTQ